MHLPAPRESCLVLMHGAQSCILVRTNLLHICISMYAQAGNHDSIEDSRAALALYRKYEQVRIDGQMNKRGRDCYSALVPAPTVHSVVCSTARLDNTVSYYAVCVCVCAISVGMVWRVLRTALRTVSCCTLRKRSWPRMAWSTTQSRSSTRTATSTSSRCRSLSGAWSLLSLQPSRRRHSRRRNSRRRRSRRSRDRLQQLCLLRGPQRQAAPAERLATRLTTLAVLTAC